MARGIKIYTRMNFSDLYELPEVSHQIFDPQTVKLKPVGTGLRREYDNFLL